MSELDFVASIAAKLPMMTIADMLGVPESHVETFTQAGDAIVNAQDDTLRPPGVSAAQYMYQQIQVLYEIGIDLVQFRRSHPSDDLASAVAAAEIDGRLVTDEEIGSLTVLMSVAGNDTTKQTTTLSVLALDRNPDQKAWLRDEFDGRIMQSIDEFVRYSSPVIQFARTATRGLELGGQRIAAGDKVAVFYCSGNRDESVFDDPHRFVLSRDPNPHLGFGGGGMHFCLGSTVARAELRALFSEMFRQLPHLHVTGEPEFVHSDLFHAVKRLPVATN
jgi:cytochrome P450